MLAAAHAADPRGSRHRARAGRGLLAAAAFLAAAAPAASAAPPAADGPPLLFLGNRNLPPVLYVEGEEPAGVAADLVRALAPRLSRPVELRLMDWPAAQALVLRGEADALVQMNPSDARSRFYDFSAPLLESRFSIFVRRDSLAIPGPAGLRGLTVGVEPGGLPEQLLSRDPGVRLVAVPDFVTGFGLLAAYDLDAVVADWRVGSYVLAKSGIRNVTVTGEPVATSRSAIAVRKGNAALLAEIDAGLQALRADGSYDRILARWAPKDVVLWTREQVVRRAAVAGAALLALLLVSTGAWLAALRRELRRRRAAEASLATRNAVLGGVINSGDAVIYSVDRAYRYTSFNVVHAARMKAAFGVDVTEGASVLEAVGIPQEREALRADLDRALAGESVVGEGWIGPEPQRYLRFSYGPIRSEAGEVVGAAAVGQDLTERRQAEETIRRMNRELRALTSSGKSLIRATDEVSLLRDVCHIICEEAGYRMAWVGYASNDPDRKIVPMAWAGVEEGYLPAANLTWADTERGRGPSGTALRTGVTACIQDFAVDSSAGPWREAALARGFRSSTALPLDDADGHTFGVLCIYASEPGAFTPDERRLLEELAADLALGINVLRARIELQRADQQRSAHLQFLESMDRVNRAISASDDLEVMAGGVLDVVLEVLGCDRAFLLCPCDPDAPAVRVVAERPGAPGPAGAGRPVELPVDPELARILREVLAADAPVRYGPGAPQPIPPRAAERHGVRAMMALALRPRVGDAWQLEVHQRVRGRAWTVDEEWLLQEIGRRLADAISTALVVRDLRASEERLERAERMVHAGYWDCDFVAGRIALSEEACRIYGLPPEERSSDLQAWLDRWHALVDPADRERAGAAMMAALEQGGPRYDLEFRIRRGGEVRWVHSQGDVVRDEHGRALRLVVTILDVTDRRRAEEALRRSEEHLRQSQKLEAVGRLAGGVAHDFNNLLTAILGDARVLADGLAPGDPLRTEATEIEAAARKAALLTRQLLAFGRKQRSEPRIVDVGETVTAMDRMLRRLIGEDVELTTVTAPGVGRIRVDPVQLEQVLLNLAVNARDAMPRGGRLVIEAANADGPGVEGGRSAAGGAWVMLAVRDTGLGMSPEVQAHLFEPFFTTKEPGKGTGLGLATVYGIVTQAGGEVRVSTEPGKGTAFEVFFPRVDAPAEAARAPAPAALPRGTETVLVVEDEPLVRALAVRVLRAAGYDVLDAGDADQALALVRGGTRARIDLLLTDVVMPRCSGPDLATRLRAHLPELPVLFASGYMDRIQDVSSQLGCRTGFIPKPFTPDELARKVRELLEQGTPAVSDERRR